MAERSDLISVSEAARYLGIHRTTVWRRVRELDIPIYRSPLNKSKHLLSWADLEKALRPISGELVVARSAPADSMLFDSYDPLSERESHARLRVLYEDSRVTRAVLLKSRAIDTFAGDSVSMATMIQGDGPYSAEDAGPFPVRDYLPTIISGMASGFLTRNDGVLRNIWDLQRPGLRIADLSALGLRYTRLYRALLAWIEMEPGDVTFVPFTRMVDSLRAVAAGTVDVAWATPMNEAVWDLEANGSGVFWIDMNPTASDKDAAGARRFREVMSEIVFRQNSEGVPSAIGFWGHRTKGLYGTRFVHADANPDFVYYLAKNRAENRVLFQRRQMTHTRILEYVQAALPELIIPIHDGAIRYFREQQIWTDADDKRQGKNLELLGKYILAWQDATAWAKAHSTAIHPSNPAWQSLWESFKRDLPRLGPGPELSVMGTLEGGMPAARGLSLNQGA